MSYHPLHDTWIMARPKLNNAETPPEERVTYYGSFPSGFLERGMAQLVVSPLARVLHVCSGRTRDYHSGPAKGKGLGPNHYMLDLDADLKPDFCMDARKIGIEAGDLFPLVREGACRLVEIGKDGTPSEPLNLVDLWDAVLIDRPYTEEDAKQYKVGAEVWPANLNDLVKRSLSICKPYARVGTIDYLWPAPPMQHKFLPRLKHLATLTEAEASAEPTHLHAVVSVLMGWNNRARVYVVYQRVPTEQELEACMAANGGIQKANALIRESNDDLADAEKEVAELKAKINKLEGEIEDRITKEEADKQQELAVSEALQETMTPIIEWGMAGGANPADMPLSIAPEARDKANTMALAVMARGGKAPAPAPIADTFDPKKDPEIQEMVRRFRALPGMEQTGTSDFAEWGRALEMGMVHRVPRSKFYAALEKAEREAQARPVATVEPKADPKKNTLAAWTQIILPAKDAATEGFE